VQEFRTPSEVSLAIGSAYFRAGDLGEAETAYLAAISVNPRMGEAHNNLAVIYMINGRLDEAENEVRLAEQSGFRVNPMFKDDLKKRRGQE
jgi:Flp pilus assembly protein TadD